LSNKIEAFNLIADIYDNWYKHPQGRQVFEAEKKVIDQIIPSGIGIEVGSGTGIFAENLRNDDRIILCLDPSTEMSSKAKDRGLFCILGLGEFLPIRVGLLDFCYMITVIEFLSAPIAVFREIQNTAKQDASLLILFINSDSSWGELYRNLGDKGDPVFQHARLYTLDEVVTLLNKSGYHILSVLGTVNSDPMNQRVDQEIVEPGEESGVLLVNASPLNRVGTNAELK
jgi:SAM-dependent methyltransferase